jgi:NAD-specific glutamate dehydrogenase
MAGEFGSKTKAVKGAKAVKKPAAQEETIVKRWVQAHGQHAEAIEPIFAEMRKATAVDLPMLIIAEQKLRDLYGG